ncbi:Hypothetical protein POVN_LOCUS173 [uncultured virus]|nr:Hypothetical protein POVN_LOCUS173 [uncultured virus]
MEQVWLFVLIVVLVSLFILVIAQDPVTLVASKGENITPAAWFEARDRLPESAVPVDQWYTRNWNNGWGPDAITYPAGGSHAPSLVSVARHYLGLPYRHHHIPGWDPSTDLTGKPNESRGLDCSNYTSWVYNYGRGFRFTSNVHKQAVMYTDYPNMQRIDRPTATTLPPFQPGDLLFFWRNLPSGEQEISHVALFTEYRQGTPYIIDSHGVGVTEHPLTGPANRWYETHFNHAIRIEL